MFIKSKEIEIDPNNPFLHCKLDRKKYAEVLTEIVRESNDGFVMAINNPWGTGKTTFIRMWEAMLRKESKCIYFNAWENDFDENPMSALLSELQVIDERKDNQFNTLLTGAATLSKTLLPSLVKSLVSKFLGSDFKEALENISKDFASLLEEDVKEYTKRKKSILDFRKKLGEYVASNSNGKPLIFIIDELDRCKPSYSVQLLEHIKHLFSVPNIIFVLSIDKTQLGNAICGYYGSEKLDSEEYLRRFIDLEYSIPEPDKTLFMNYLYHYYNFDYFFNLIENKEKEYFYKCVNIFFHEFSLRQLEKVYYLMNLVFYTNLGDNIFKSSVFVPLIYLKLKNEKLYNNLVNKDITVIKFHEELTKILFSKLNDQNSGILVSIEAQLIMFYDQDRNLSKFNSELMVNHHHENVTNLKIHSKINSNIFETIINELKNTNRLWEFRLSFILNKIALLENFSLKK